MVLGGFRVGDSRVRVAHDGKRWHGCRLNPIHHHDSVTEGVPGAIHSVYFFIFY